jgi:hypothetical protein
VDPACSWANGQHTIAVSRRLRVEIPPGHSPDPMPVEALWHWLRADVTCHHCHATAEDLTRRVAAREASVHASPHAAADRLWVKDHLDPNEEKLRFSYQPDKRMTAFVIGGTDMLHPPRRSTHRVSHQARKRSSDTAADIKPDAV